MMAAITGRRASQLLTNREGMGSNGQDFNADRRISEATSPVDTFSKSVNSGTDTDGESSGTESNKEVTESNDSMSRLRWMVSILVTKYCPRSLTNVGACKFGGRPSSRDTFSKRLLARNSLRWLRLFSSIKFV